MAKVTGIKIYNDIIQKNNAIGNTNVRILPTIASYKSLSEVFMIYKLKIKLKV